MSIYSKQYQEMADYVGAAVLPPAGEQIPTIVFGRQDIRVAQAAVDLAGQALASVMVVTGGIGKDSGDLLDQGYTSEADYLSSKISNVAQTDNVTLPPLIREEKATNGHDNAVFGLRTIDKAGYPTDEVVGVMHRFSALRLAGTVEYRGAKIYGKRPVVYRVPTNISFDVSSLAHRDEVTTEFLRVADWPAMGELLPQPDIPANLVDFAHDIHGQAPRPVSPVQSMLLRRLPPRARLGAIRFAAVHGRK